MNEKTLVELLEYYFQEQGFLTATEISAGYGRADLVLGKLNEKHSIIRKSHNQLQPLFKEFYFEVLRKLPDIDHDEEPIHIDELVSNVSFSENNLKYRILSYLEENRYIEKVDNKYLYKINGWVPLTSEIIAIEAKLTNWKRAFLQANRYKSFADKVYIAMPENKSHLVDKDLLTSHGVGLFSFDESNGLTELVKAKKTNESVPDKRNLVSEHIWASSLAFN